MINNAISEKDSAQHVYYSIVRNSLCRLLKGSPGSVLEIGCGTGKTLEYLKKNGASKAIGIELRHEVAAAASQNQFIDQIYNIDFFDDNSPIKDDKFDTIILSHVLEHFTNPVSALTKIKLNMHSNSTLLVAVPNIRHISVIFPLVFKGDFSYRDSGILDHTHYKFYTKKTIVSTLRSNGFKIDSVEIDFAGPRSRTCNKLSLGLVDEFIGFAINVSASLMTDPANINS